MPRSSGSDMPQRKSPRGPSQLRTSSSDSDPSAAQHHRPRTERSPKVGADRRSPRATQIEPLNQKKLGTRIADLESQLGQAQEELKCLKDQLASAEAAKKVAQEQLEKKSNKKPNTVPKPEPEPEPIHIQGNHSSMKSQDLKKSEEENQKETDVFEVPSEMKSTVGPELELDLLFDQAANEEGGELKTKSMNPKIEPPEPEKDSFEELTMKIYEINSLKARLEEKEREMGALSQQNESLCTQLSDKSSEISATQSKLHEMNLKLNQVSKELEESKKNAVQINEKLQASEKGKEELEAEIKKMRVQTEQWRKAADAAATVLSGGVEVGMNGRRISERCGSMDKHFGSVLETTTDRRGVGGYLGSPGLPEDSAAADVYEGTAKRRGSGIRMFGDMWKRKGQK